MLDEIQHDESITSRGEETRTASLGLRIKPSLKEALERLADADRRTVNSYIELLLEAHVEAKKQAGKKR